MMSLILALAFWSIYFSIYVIATLYTSLKYSGEMYSMFTRYAVAYTSAERNAVAIPILNTWLLSSPGVPLKNFFMKNFIRSTHPTSLRAHTRKLNTFIVVVGSVCTFPLVMSCDHTRYNIDTPPSASPAMLAVFHRLLLNTFCSIIFTLAAQR